MAKKAHRRGRRCQSNRSIDLLMEAVASIVREFAVNADARSLKPSELCRLLNSTPLNEVITVRRLKVHRDRAGMKIGDVKTVDLIRYSAWLFHARTRPSALISQEMSADEMHDAYDRKRSRAVERERKATSAGKDIGDLPKVKNKRRKTRCGKSFRAFCETYFPERFTMGWSDDHLKVMSKIERAIIEGGLFALAMPRGSGKTTLCECAALWAILYGYRAFIMLIGSDASSALELLGSIKIELDTNDLLLADFPEACFPIRALEGVSQRCKGQLFQGHRTHIGWKGETLVMPTMPDSKASGALVRVAGITGRIRGAKCTRPDGKSVRPDFVIPDDPQTDESANSPSQCEHRERLLAGAILGLAGPGKKIAGVMPCTVIRRGDMADSILDRKKHPEWQGERMRMVYDWPPSDASKTKMDAYAELRAEELANERGLKKATAFWKRNKKVIEAGSRIGWKERFNPDECSALQHAFNLQLADPRAFEAEYQNDPIDATADNELLTVDQLMAKVNGYRRGQAPQEATHVTCFVDVQGELLYWLVAAWSEDFTGYVLDYGAWPDQKQRYFTLTAARHTLSRKYPGTGLEGRLHAGLIDLTTELLDRRWKRDDKAELSIERLLIDANWGQSTNVVYQFVRQSSHASIILPTHGRGVTAGNMMMKDWNRKPGEQVGLNLRIRRTTGSRAAVRHGLYDTNFWKSFIHARLAVAKGDTGCLSFFKPSVKTEHKMLAEQLRAEARDRKTSELTGRTVDEWKLKPGNPDNHLFDCLVGSAVAASITGCALPVDREKAPRKKLKLSEIQARKRQERGR
jgi:Terminase large subunit gpA, endonuclease domain